MNTCEGHGVFRRRRRARQIDTVLVVNVEVEPTQSVADLKAQLRQMRNVSSYQRDVNYRGLKCSHHSGWPLRRPRHSHHSG